MQPHSCPPHPRGGGQIGNGGENCRSRSLRWHREGQILEERKQYLVPPSCLSIHTFTCAPIRSTHPPSPPSIQTPHPPTLLLPIHPAISSLNHLSTHLLTYSSTHLITYLLTHLPNHRLISPSLSVHLSICPSTHSSVHPSNKPPFPLSSEYIF